jgi:hypothetical protein
MAFRTTYNNAFHPNEDVLLLEGAHLNQAITEQLGTHNAVDFSTDLASVFSLSLPDPTDCYEDWIHTEQGPRGRWIIRLLRFYRAERSQPWKSKELYVADRDEHAVPMATAYGRAWLYSHATWPVAQTKETYPLAS